MSSSNEVRRLAVLRQLNLLDTAPSEAFDRTTRMASQLFNLPIAAISLTDHDRQWFKSRVGVEHFSLPRDGAPCAQVTDTNGVVVIEDLLLDASYRDSPLARTGVRFYAGAPLITRDGFCLGALCVLGMTPRPVSAPELASLTDLASMVMSQIELQHSIGRVDPVSGLPNRHQFFDDLDDIAKEQTGEAQRIAVLVDLASPEQLSHASRVMGVTYVDDLISEAVEALCSGIDPTRKSYHVAGCQFAFLAPPGTLQTDYVRLLAKMLHAVRHSAKAQYVTTTVIGVAPFTPGKVLPRDVMRMAQSAAQDARSSESGVSVYSRLQDMEHRRRFALQNDFGKALQAGGQLSLVYQPRIDLLSGACVGAEALLRWQHPDLGHVSPAEFIPVVEQTVMTRSMTSWVLDAALTQIAMWRDRGLHLRLSINVSATNLLEKDLSSRILHGLARHALPVNCLELEVTESAVMTDAARTLAVLNALASAGLLLAIDDFGTGYSSLSYLQRLPAKVVKIDRSFICDLGSDKAKQILVAAMVTLSHDLGYRVVAEGVETQEELDLVKRLSCDEVQGFYFGRPMLPDAFVTWFGKQNSDFPRRPDPFALAGSCVLIPA